MAIAKNPTETSPLLGSQRNGNATLDPASTGAICNSDPEAPCPVDGEGTTPDNEVDDHRNKLRYIIPAISIGVWTQFALLGPLFRLQTDTIAPGLFVRGGPDDHRRQLWADWQRP